MEKVAYRPRQSFQAVLGALNDSNIATLGLVDQDI